MSVSKTIVADTESCEVDFVTMVCLMRREPVEGEGFHLSEFVGRSLFLPKRGPVISNLLTNKEGEIGFCG